MWCSVVHGAIEIAVPHRTQAENGNVGRLPEVRTDIHVHGFAYTMFNY